MMLVLFSTLLLLFSAIPSYDDPYVLSFKMLGRLMIIEGVADGDKGWYIVDTGAPGLVLNDKYFDGHTRNFTGTGMRDINGNMGNLPYKHIKSFEIQGLEFRKMDARVIDLDHLEKHKGLAIAGMIGFEFFKNYEVTFDYENYQIQLIRLDKKGNRLGRRLSPPPTDSLDLKMKGHFPFVSANIQGQNVRFGIDTGAEVNVLGNPLPRRLESYFVPLDTIKVAGFQKQTKRVMRGNLIPLAIGQYDYSNTEFVTYSLAAFNENSSGAALDGLLGQPFLSNYRTAINYKKRRLYLWRTTESP